MGRAAHEPRPRRHRHREPGALTAAEDASVGFPGEGPEEARTIRAFRIRGTGGGPCAYLQAGLHADEIPGMLVLHELLPLLAAEATAGRLLGDVTLVPHANPIGARQFAHGRLRGRFDEATGKNFNRDFSRAENPRPGLEAWQAALLHLAEGADLVFDLHTDDEAVPYLYVHAALWPAASDLAAALEVAAVLTWEEGGGGAFEDAVVARWLAAGRTAGRLVATVELRGQADVSDTLARRDAAGLLAVLRGRGVLAGPSTLPRYAGLDLPVAHVQTVRAPADGMVVFRHAPGDRLAAGAAFARLVSRPGDASGDIPLAADGAGLLLTRVRDRYVRRGSVVAKLSGDAPSPSWRAAPLDDD